MGLQKGDYTVIYMDIKKCLLHYYNSNSGKVSHETKQINERPFSNEYYGKFAECVKEFIMKHPPASAAQTTIVIPDEAVFRNLALFPNSKMGDYSKPLDIYLNTTFPNVKKLEVKSNKVMSNKQNAAFLITGIQKILIDDIKEALNNAHLVVNNFTFASNAAICGLKSLSPKLQTGTYMFLDVKPDEARIILITKGIVSGSYYLPMGFKNMNAEKVLAEDVLLYQPHAELLVVNAREKAKRKALTMAGADNVTQTAEAQEAQDSDPLSGDEEQSFTSLSQSTQVPVQEVTIKTLPKKTARKLPKFMQREMPEDEERKVYESFRFFIKWTLDVIKNNENLLTIDRPSVCYVNLPKDLNFLLDIAAEEAEENNIKFVPSGLAKEKDEVQFNLEMYGGLISKEIKNSIMF